MKNVQEIRKRSETTLLWRHQNTWFKVQILPQKCPNCGIEALTGLPEPLRLAQPDKTNVVCNPFLNGCNHGYEMNVDPECLSCEWSEKL